MPDSSSPFDDPFADLFGKLPDPRTPRQAMPGGQNDAKADAATPASAPPAPASDGGTAAPLSRRAARAASAPLAASRPASAQPPVSFPATVASANPAAPSATLEDLFTGNRTSDELGAPPPPPDKRKRRIGGWIAFGIVLVLLGGIAGGGLWAWNTYEDKIRAFMGWEEPKDYTAGMATGEAFVTVAAGDTGSPISQSLFDAGVTKTPTAFYDYLIDTGQNPPFVPGVFKLQKQMTSEAALAALIDPANKMSNTAQLREGLTVAESLPKLAEATGLPLADFEAAVATPATYGVTADSLEGWLFPATYTFDPGVTATDVITTLVNRTVTSLDNASVPVEQRQEILTIASIIQREARFEADFYKVSRVIQNRLSPDNQDTFGKLQMDSTAQYGYGEMHDGTVSTSQAALEDDNPWNTYVVTGLPAGPISNPGDTAIDAAMHPADGGLALLRDRQPRHGRDGVHQQHHRSQRRRRAVAVVVQRPPGLGVLSGATRLAVWGDPIAHSRSPQLHAAAYAVLGLPWSYERRRVAASDFAPALAPLDDTWRGLSVTFPLKAEAFAAAVERDRRAELTGAVNTLLRERDGRFRGFNTDVGGIVRALHDDGVDVVDRARIVGAGATAASAMVALGELGAHTVEVLARRPPAVAPLAALGERLGIDVVAMALDSQDFAEVPVTIATLPGEATLADSIADALAAPGGLLLDVVYGHWPTPLSRAWERTGLRARSGLGMLLHQALLQVRVFTTGEVGTPLPNEDAVLRAMRSAVTGD